VNFSRSGRHYLWIRGWAPRSSSDSVHAGLNGATPGSAQRVELGPNLTPTWSNARRSGRRAFLTVPDAGEHRLDIWMDEDGVVLDKFVLTGNAAYVPTGTGPEESPCRDDAVATPVIVPDGGNFTASVDVRLRSATGDAVIYYTLDGRTPDETAAQYSDPITLTASATVSARAFLGGWAASGVARASFVIGSGTAAFQQGGDGLVSMELEHNTNSTTASGHSWRRVTPAGASAGAAMEAMPNNGASINSGYVTSSPRIDLPVNFTRSGVHHVWVRGLGASGTDDSLHVGLDGAAASTARRISRFSSRWRWSKRTMDGTTARIDVPAPGLHTVNVWMREDGFVGDKLVLTPAAGYTPTGTGPEESPFE